MTLVTVSRFALITFLRVLSDFILVSETTAPPALLQFLLCGFPSLPDHPLLAVPGIGKLKVSVCRGTSAAGNTSV